MPKFILRQPPKPCPCSGPALRPFFSLSQISTPSSTGATRRSRRARGPTQAVARRPAVRAEPSPAGPPPRGWGAAEPSGRAEPWSCQPARQRRRGQRGGGGRRERLSARSREKRALSTGRRTRRFSKTDFYKCFRCLSSDRFYHDASSTAKQTYNLAC